MTSKEYKTLKELDVFLNELDRGCPRAYPRMRKHETPRAFESGAFLLTGQRAYIAIVFLLVFP